MNGVVSNKNRKYRASRPEPGGFPKGNAHSSFRGRTDVKDLKPAFSGLHPYRVDPFEEIGGVFFDAPKVKAKPTPTAKAPKATKPSRKARVVRTAPPAGTRPSLAAIRSKG